MEFQSYRRHSAWEALAVSTVGFGQSEQMKRVERNNYIFIFLYFFNNIIFIKFKYRKKNNLDMEKMMSHEKRIESV